MMNAVGTEWVTPGLFMMNAVGTEWVTPGLPRMSNLLHTATYCKSASYLLLIELHVLRFIHSIQRAIIRYQDSIW